MSLTGILTYDENHSLAGQTVEPTGPSLMSYDTKTFKVTDYHNFGEDFSIYALKAAAINAMESFTHAYSQTIGVLLDASEKCVKRIQSGNPVLDPKSAVGCLNRSQMRMEEALRKILDWDGEGEVAVLLPYSEVAMMKDRDDNEIVDTNNSRPYVNGMLFVIRFK